ncbi:hypothetical protein [Actinomadura mexicana]|uniref:Uncharacterized protein n=1 Tax=Actinomadura mexicana TaxID=134959 RepID=A0A239GLG8_9ACTN|nr:hypothetical protein [Actinomadura mexicana]SNS69960.1 hypothetical protein SAMN06265355_12530 [Actinomadura mexicana]
MGWIEPKNLQAEASTSSITGHLDRLAHELIREGWKAVPRYDGPLPLLRVFDPAVPGLGESVTLAPGSTSDAWWYRSSTGEDLAPHTSPARAAERITRILTPYVAAALAARARRPVRDGTALRIPPPGPDTPHTETIAYLRARFGVLCWWGTHTKEWWALIPCAAQWRLVNAPASETLAQAILDVHAHS